MTIESWYEWAVADADRRGLAALKPLLDGLRAATRELREADWNDDAADLPTAPPPAAPETPSR
jgi:hypothetical protein